MKISIFEGFWRRNPQNRINHPLDFHTVLGHISLNWVFLLNIKIDRINRNIDIDIIIERIDRIDRNIDTDIIIDRKEI